jgi:hypothetical protein
MRDFWFEMMREIGFSSARAFKRERERERERERSNALKRKRSVTTSSHRAERFFRSLF